MTTATEINAYVHALQQSYLSQRLRGGTAPITFGSTIESDKRSQARILRELTAAGFIKPDPTTPINATGDTRHLIDVSVYNLIESAEPDLVTMAKSGVWGGDVVGVPSDKLTAGQLRWIIEHPDAYTGIWTNGFKQVPQPTIGAPMKAAGYGWNLWVSSPALDAWNAEVTRARKIADLFRTNLPHGLKTIAAIDKADAEGWNIADAQGGEPVGFGYGGLSRLLGHDPRTWEADAAAIVSKAQARVQRALDDLASVVRVQAAVSQVGGWAAIARGLHEAVVEHVDNPKPAEPAETATTEPATANAEETRS
jgi:hypothetical protein